MGLALLFLSLFVLSGCSSKGKEADVAPSEGGAPTSALQPTNQTSSGTDFPSKPVRIVAGAPAGSTIDSPMRFLEPAFSAALGEAVVIENMPGAGSNVANAYVWKEQPDGYTLLATYVPSIDIGPIVSPDVGFVPLEFTHVYNIVGGAGFSPVILVRSDSPYESLADLAEAAKERPDTIRVGHPGISSTGAAALRMFEQSSGATFRDVPFEQAADAAKSVIGGQIEASVQGNALTVLPLLQQGEGRVLGVLGSERNPDLPNVPTAEEAGFPNVIMDQLIGLFAPPNTPKEIVDILSAAIEEAVQDKEFQQRLSDYGQPLFPLNPEQFAQKHRELAAGIDRVKDSLIPAKN